MLHKLFTAEKQCHLEEIDVFVSSGGLEKLVRIYKLKEITGIDLISSFLAWFEVYSSLRLELQITTDFYSKNSELSGMILSTFSHFISCLLCEIDNQLKEERLDIVDKLIFLKTNSVFLNIEKKRFRFSFESLLNFASSLNPIEDYHRIRIL